VIWKIKKFKCLDVSRDFEPVGNDQCLQVREKLLTEQLRMERTEKVKKLRDLKKYGKKVRSELLQLNFN